MTGNDGVDVFIFGTNNGVDVITDFLQEDILQIAANINGSGIASAADVLSFVSYNESGALIDFGGGNSITLNGLIDGDMNQVTINII